MSLGFVKLALAMKEGEEEFKKVFDEASDETILSYLNSCIDEYEDHTKGNPDDTVNDKNGILKSFTYCAEYNDPKIALTAKYWKGVCLSEGFGTSINKLEAKALFKEVVENDSTDNHLKNEAQARFEAIL